MSMLGKVLEAALMAVFNKVKDKAMDKIKEEAQGILDRIGVKIDELTDEAAQKIVEWKAGQDKETRRTMRAAWACISVLTFAAGMAVGHYFL